MKIQKNKKDVSPMDRVDTPPPAQEIHPLEQSQNDGKKNKENKKGDKGSKKQIS